MIERMIEKIESVSKEQIGACALIVLLAGFSLGFGFGKGVEYSIQDKPKLQSISDEYKMDLIQQMAVSRK